MGIYNDFGLALAAGKKVEDLATEQLKKLGFTVVDVSDDKTYQKKDIDLLAEHICNPSMTIEVKADSRIADTDKICIETITNKAAKKRVVVLHASNTYFLC